MRRAGGTETVSYVNAKGKLIKNDRFITVARTEQVVRAQEVAAEMVQRVTIRPRHLQEGANRQKRKGIEIKSARLKKYKAE